MRRMGRLYLFVRPCIMVIPFEGKQTNEKNKKLIFHFIFIKKLCKNSPGKHKREREREREREKRHTLGLHS